MEFEKGKDGRPQGTSLTKAGVIHYTCNAPGDEVRRENGILAIGKMFAVAAAEVLLIPTRLFTQRRVEVGTAEAETILRDLGDGS